MNARAPIHFLPDKQKYRPCVRIAMGFSQGLGYGMLGLFGAFVFGAIVGMDSLSVIFVSCCTGLFAAAIGFSTSASPQTHTVVINPTPIHDPSPVVGRSIHEARKTRSKQSAMNDEFALFVELVDRFMGSLPDEVSKQLFYDEDFELYRRVVSKPRSITSIERTRFVNLIDDFLGDCPEEYSRVLIDSGSFDIYRGIVEKYGG